MKYLVLAILALSAPLSAAEKTADEQIKEFEPFALEWAGKFAECSAVFDIYARMDSKTDEEYGSHHVHQLGNGAISSAIYMAGLIGYKPGYAEGIKETKLSAWSLVIKRGGIDEFAVKAKHCMSKEVNGFQGEIVDIMRKEMYKSK